MKTKQPTNEAGLDILKTFVSPSESLFICLTPGCDCEAPKKKKGEPISELSITFALHAWNKAGDCRDFNVEFGTVNKALKELEPDFIINGVGFVPSSIMGKATEHCEYNDFFKFMGGQEDAMLHTAKLVNHCNVINQKITDLGWLSQ